MNPLDDNKLIQGIKQKIAGKNKKIVIPEGDEIRVIKSLKYTPDIKKILIGNRNDITSKIVEVYPEKHEEIKQAVEIIDPKNYENTKLIEKFLEIRKGKLTLEEAEELILNRVYFATMLLETGVADALVGGSYYPTADILRSAFQIIKPKKGSQIVSSFFLMERGERQLLFSDCAVNANPTARQLKDITLQTIQSALDFGIDPKVALLSYSTKNSGQGESVEKIKEVYKLIQAENPELSKCVDGELQFDAAYDPIIAEIKTSNSLVAGQANVFIFPNLEAGNIGYKIAQLMGDWNAIGPLLQGLNKPANDLSRGTNAKTIAQVMYLSLK